MKYIAYITKGLGNICFAELSTLDGASTISSEEKFIQFTYEDEVENLQNLRTIDDLALFIAEIPVSRLLEEELSDEVKQIKESLKFLKTFRELGETFSITISRYKNDFTSPVDLKEQLSNYFSEILSLHYTPTDHTNIDIRISITEYTCTIGIKLFPESLYKRQYRHESTLGSIRSTIAAAMLRQLTNGDGGHTIVDSFCGSGTFLCEGIVDGNEVYGSDIDPKVAKIAKSNLERASEGEFELAVGGAEKTPWDNEKFDIAVSNLPWNKLIQVDNNQKLYEEMMKEYHRIMKPRSKLGFLTTEPELLIGNLKKYFSIIEMDVFRIGYQGQVPTIILTEVEKL